MVRKVVDELFDGFDPYPVGVIECPPIDVELSHREPLDHDFIGLSIDASRAIVVHRSGHAASAPNSAVARAAELGIKFDRRHPLRSADSSARIAVSVRSASRAFAEGDGWRND